jgi:hypothetical protein
MAQEGERSESPQRDWLRVLGKKKSYYSIILQHILVAFLSTPICFMYISQPLLTLLSAPIL